MAIAKTRIHMICGLCGNNESFKFKISPKGNCDKLGNEYPAVFITCGNCSTLTGLDNIIKEDREELQYIQNKELNICKVTAKPILIEFEKQLEEEATLITEAIADVMIISNLNDEETAKKILRKQFVIINRQDLEEE